MTAHRDPTTPQRLRRATTEASAIEGGPATAQIIGLTNYLAQTRGTAKAAASPQVEKLLTTLRAEVAFAAGISRGLGETLVRFQDSLTGLSKEIARCDTAELQAMVLKQTALLRATMLATSADLQRVLPEMADDVSDSLRESRPDFIY